MSIKLSICIPTYNRPDTLKLLLDSIYYQIQDCSDQVEVCISDNASPDSTREVVEQYLDKMNLHYHKHEEPIHPILNWNYVIKYMPVGEYVLMVGDDDIFINDGINRMLQLIEEYPSEYYYLNHIHNQVNVNEDIVYNHNCKVEIQQSECECYDMHTHYVDKWEELLLFDGKDQEVNMLFIGNHLMKNGMWDLDEEKFRELYEKYGKDEFSEESLDYYYSTWSPQIEAIAQSTMGKKVVYCADSIVSQGMGENTSELYQIMLLTFLNRWIDMFYSLGMDDKIFVKYKEYIEGVEANRLKNMLQYKRQVVQKYMFCLKTLFDVEKSSVLFKVLELFGKDSVNYYQKIATSNLERQLGKVLSEKDSRVVLWGTGDVGRNLIEESASIKDTIDYVVDGNKTTWGKTFELLNQEIHNPETLKDANVYMVIIASVKYEEEIKNTLMQNNVSYKYILGTKGLDIAVTM